MLDVDGGARPRLPLVRRRPHRRGAVPQQRGQAGGRRQTSRGTFSGNTGARLRRPASRDRQPARTRSARVATANLPSDDIVLKLIGPGGSAVASSDTGDQPGGRQLHEQRREGRRRHLPDRRLRVRRPDGPGQRRQLRLHRRLRGQHGRRRAERPPATRRGSTSRNAPAGDNRDRRLLPAGRRLRRRPQQHRLARPVGRDRRHRHADVHHAGQQRPHGRGAHHRRSRPARSASCRPRSRASTGSRSPNQWADVEVRPDAARSCPAAAPTSRPRSRTCSPATTASTTSPTTSASPSSTTTCSSRTSASAT